MYAHRQDVSFSRITSSDHSSSWRSSLKANLVTDCKQTREDLVIRSLARRTEATFGGDIRSNLESDYYGSSRRQDDARRVKSRAPSQSLVSTIDDETLCVKSFVSSSKYKIAIDPKEHSVLSCSCPDFFTRGRECKHIALVKLERPTYRFGTKPASRGPVAQKRSLKDGPSLKVSAVKMASINESLAAIGKSTEDMSTGEEIRAALALIKTLLDRATEVQGKKMRIK